MLLVLPAAKAANDIEIPSALIKIVEAVEIPALNEGVLASVLVREGDIVAVGDLLAQVDDTQAQLRSNQAEMEAEISSREAKNDVLPRLARKTHELAVTELKRGHDVNKGFPNSVSQRDLNILQLTVDKAELEMEQALHDMKISGLNDKLKQAQLQLTRNEVARYAIRAPLPGMIVHVDKRKGEWVSAGDLVVRVVRVDRVRAEGFVAAREAAFGSHIVVGEERWLFDRCGRNLRMLGKHVEQARRAGFHRPDDEREVLPPQPIPRRGGS